DIMKNDEIVIPALKSALERQTARVLAAEVRDDAAGREVTIMGDREIPYKLLKKIMATCTAADYGQLSLAVLQKASESVELAATGRRRFKRFLGYPTGTLAVLALLVAVLPVPERDAAVEEVPKRLARLVLERQLPPPPPPPPPRVVEELPPPPPEPVVEERPAP